MELSTSVKSKPRHFGPARPLVLIRFTEHTALACRHIRFSDNGGPGGRCSFLPRLVSLPLHFTSGLLHSRSIKVKTMVPSTRLPAILLLVTVLPATAAEPLKVGVIGLDNYQAVAFTQLYHDAKAAGDLKGIRVVAAFPAGSPDIDE